MPDANQHVVFEEEVRKHFHFLETDYGFHLSHVKNIGPITSVRYESTKVYVSLYHGPPAYEVGMSFGRIGVDDVAGAYSFELGDLILLERCRTWIWNPANTNDVYGSLAEYARLLRECGSDCLQGSEFVFTQMKKKREELIQNWKQEERINNVKREAIEAWSQKDYERVVKLYESISASLTAVETKKLEYARKHPSI